MMMMRRAKNTPDKKVMIPPILDRLSIFQTTRFQSFKLLKLYNKYKQFLTLRVFKVRISNSMSSQTILFKKIKLNRATFLAAKHRLF